MELRQAKPVDPDVAEFLADVDRGLQPHLKSALERIPDLHPLKEGLTYQVMSGGKRIRAALCVTSSEVFGADGSRALDFAATIEHLQNFTLIHDDIADGDTQRRYASPSGNVSEWPTALILGTPLPCLRPWNSGF